MAKKKKLAVQLINFNSTEGSRYIYRTYKNLKTKTDKKSYRKYHPVLKKHVIFNEGKPEKG